MTDPDTPALPQTDRQRATATGVTERRQVKAALAATAAGLEELQRDAAFLAAMSQHNKSGAIERTNALRKRVDAAKARLERAVAKLPQELRNHGRVTDLRNAIASLEARLPRSGHDKFPDQ